MHRLFSKLFKGQAKSEQPLNWNRYLIECAGKGDLAGVQKAVEAGADVNWVLRSDPQWRPQFPQDTPFSYPSYTVDSGYARETCALHAAVLGAHRDIVHYLLGQKTDIRLITINDAIESQPFEMIVMLAKKRLEAKWHTDEKSDLLATACRHGRRDIAEFLIGFGADVNGAHYYRAPKPAREAALNNYAGILKMLFSEGADPHVIRSLYADRLSPSVQRILQRQNQKLEAA